MESDLPMVEGSRRWYRTLRPLAIDVREENERLRILAEMEASMRIYSMLANLSPVPPNMLPLSEH